MRALNELKKVSILTISVLILLGSGSISCAQSEQTEPKRILVIYSYYEGLLWERLIDDSLRATLEANSTDPIDVNVEHTDRVSYPENEYLLKLIDLYGRKYSDPKMDLVIGIDDEATEILLKYGEELFPGVPMVFVTAERKDLQRNALKPNMTSLFWGLDIEGTVELIKKILPRTKHLFIISGSSPSDQAVNRLTRKVLAGYTNRLEINYLAGLTIEDLLRRVSQLPENSAVIYLVFSQDPDGKSFVPRKILSVISEKANAPMFGIVGTYHGQGIIGGKLLSPEVQGKRCAEIGLRILQGEPPMDIISQKTFNVSMFDWRQLKRWSIAEDRLPPDSIVRFKELGIWDRYKKQFLGAIALIIVQTLIIFYLLHQHHLRRRAEDELLQAEQKYRTVADYTFDWEYWKNPDGSFQYVSPSCERISGYTAQDFMKNPSLLHDIIVPEDIDTWNEHRRISQKEMKSGAFQFRIQRPDGEIRWIEHACQPVFDHKGNNRGVRASNRDISKRKHYETEALQLQSELTHVDRVSTIGTLTSALAHEINQPLAAMRSYAQAGLRFLDADQPDYDNLRIALQGIVADNKRASSVISHLRSMVKKEKQSNEAFDVNSMIDRVVILLNSEIILRNTKVTLNLHPNVPTFFGDSVQIQQMIINLLINALDAIDDQSVENRHIIINTKTEKPSDIIVSISDSGGGIDPNKMEEIFNPFYTTKSQGMGLGLSICRSIIEVHGGQLDCMNNPEGGATFSFTLPSGSKLQSSNNK
jgi:PAS domain S-box-containing protein